MNKVFITLTPEQEISLRAQIRHLLHSELESFQHSDNVEQRYLNKRQTCAYLNISNNTLDQWIKQGLPIIRIKGAVRFDKQAIDNWLLSLAQSR